MKWIKYKINENIEKSIRYSEEHLAIAESEALNGEYVIEDDGVEETHVPTTDEVLAVLLGIGGEV